MNYRELKRIIQIQKDGGASLEEANALISTIVKSNGSYPLDEALIQIELVYKIGPERAITEELNDFILVTKGYFSVTDCYQALKAVTKQAKTAIRVGLHRLTKANLLERDSKKDGIFRRIETDSTIIDWQNADISKTKELFFPFELEKYVTIYPKNIMVIAGTPNSGKTALLLNFIKLNQHQHKIVYFTSEMSPEEMKLRLSKFIGVEWVFEAKERSSKFADAIEPDKINVIDYLELTNEVYLIAEELKTIHERLKSGIAFIAIQKKRGAELGRGAEFSLEKPRLYLSMDKGLLTVIKAKNWAQEGVNPNGIKWKFKLVNGAIFKNIECLNIGDY